MLTQTVSTPAPQSLDQLELQLHLQNVQKFRIVLSRKRVSIHCRYRSRFFSGDGKNLEQAIYHMMGKIYLYNHSVPAVQ